MASRYYLVFWSRRSTATVVPAATASQARSRAHGRRKAGYGTLLSTRQANAADRRLIRKGVWVRRRRTAAAPSSALLLREQRPDASAAVTATGCERTYRCDAVTPARNPDQAGVGGGVATPSHWMAWSQ